ncbi:MAG TPA: hypothetical protein VLE70_02670, partial [Anaerolineae bacterium]|nr:hypothetical protein [Anaerolineae bacterium]
RAVSEPDENLHAFVHLISAKDETIISQQDRIPVDWLRPTQGWRENEVIIDTYQLFLPDDLPAGDYHLYAGLYDPETDIRAPVTYQGQSLPDGRLRLVTLAAP